jgi:hypothetical protein
VTVVDGPSPLTVEAAYFLAPAVLYPQHPPRIPLPHALLATLQPLMTSVMLSLRDRKRQPKPHAHRSY